MMDFFKKDRIAVVALLIFLFFTSWWALLTLGFFGEESMMPDIFSDTYALMALFGGVWGLIISREWGGYKSVIGRAIIAFSLGLLAQVFGQLTYAYFFWVQGIDNPYPSIGDLGFFGSIPLYIYGVFSLAKASGVILTLRNWKVSLVASIIPLSALVISYFLFVDGIEIDPTQPVATFLNFAYPLGQALYVSLTVMTYLLSFKILGGLMRNRILLLLGALVTQYIADFVYLYITSRDSWISGSFSEYIYLTAYFVMTLGIIKMSSVFKELKAGISQK